MLKRVFDIMFSLFFLIVLSPLIVLVALAIIITDGMPVFFRQQRIGLDGKPFSLFKFRSMTNKEGSENGSFDVGSALRVTAVGRLLRKTKIDELPQLWNVFLGQMSMVGPRPEVRKWVDAYPQRWKKVLAVKPGITDPASIVFRNEEELLFQQADPEEFYRNAVLPKKLDHYEEYARNNSFFSDLRLILNTVLVVVGGVRYTKGCDCGPLLSSEVKVPFSVVKCGQQELDNLKKVINSGWLTTGPFAHEFEKRFAAFVGAGYALAVNSCTSALHLAAEALGVGPGDKVIVPTMTFTASAEVLRYLNANPVFVDVEYGTSLLEPQTLRKALEKNPDAKAVVVVHYGGQAAQMIGKGGEGIVDICREFGVRIIEDAAHAFPAKCGDHTIGSIGDVTCFSFYANKTITTGDGGMLTTNDPEIAKRASVMRLHGIDRDAWDRYSTSAKKPSWEYDIVAPGFKYNMPDVNAAIGLAQFEKAEPMRKARQRAAQRYLDRLSGVIGLDLPVLKCDPASHAWHLFPVTLNGKSPKVRERNEMIDLLWERGVRTSVHYKPLHRMSYYRDVYQLSEVDYPNAERIWENTFSLPLYATIRDEQIDYVCLVLAELLGM